MSEPLLFPPAEAPHLAALDEAVRECGAAADALRAAVEAYATLLKSTAPSAYHTGLVVAAIQQLTARLGALCPRLEGLKR
jgi:hypothetical protein